ncbi:hypothetical protein LTR85_006217 [Meristemomyces frigidus]|nr:hypothetical protein LTR85_006217 [Meristemomyces frigidus]
MASADANTMAAMAARLMGKAPVAATRRAPPPTSASASVPRSMPTTQLTSNENVAPLARAQAEAPPVVKITSAPASNVHSTTTPTLTPSSPPALTERNTNVDAANLGPSLRGDAKALEAAREFLQQASKGSTRPSRTRPTSGRTSVSSASSSHSSPRTTRAQQMLASNQRAFPPPAAPVAPLPRPPPTTAAPGWNSFSTLHNRPAITSSTTPTFIPAKPQAPVSTPIFTPAKPPTPVAAPKPAQRNASSDWFSLQKPSAPVPAQTSTPTPTFTTQPKTEPMADLTKITATITPTAPATKEDKAAGLFCAQMADVKNTLTERKTDLPPPHLRKAAASSAAKGTTAEPSMTAAKQVNGVETKPSSTATPSEAPAKPIITSQAAAPVAQFEAKAPIHPTFSFAPVNPTAETKPKAPIQPTSTFASSDTTAKLKTAAQPTTSTFQPKPMSGKELKATSDAVTLGTRGDPIILDGVKEKKADKDAVTNGDDVMAVLAGLKREVAALTAKVQRLETDNIGLRDQMGQLIKAEERRKFLGTDSAKAPFKLDLTYPDNEVRSIQVFAAHRISDLIRSARTAANIVVSDNPRIEVDGVQVGHGMMLGEVGVVRGTTKKVVFCYDGADDEEL